MDPRKLFVDERLVGRCAYCAGAGDTRDHVPSRILLDEPFPENLPVVSACHPCNNSFSLDELYLACFIDCTIVGNTEPGERHRDKVRRVLEETPSLRSLIETTRSLDEHGRLLWEPDPERVRSVILKLARGHLAYEYSEVYAEEPQYVSVVPMAVLSKKQFESFENSYSDPIWPEIGSRAFHRVVIGGGGAWACDGWCTVQEGRYRYVTSPAAAVKLVLSEYLACEVGW